jgi:hypothetical protein
MHFQVFNKWTQIYLTLVYIKVSISCIANEVRQLCLTLFPFLSSPLPEYFLKIYLEIQILILFFILFVKF